MLPHRPIDVQASLRLASLFRLQFFAPHIGILYGKYDLLDRLTAYKVRPAGDLPPDKFETGTLSFEAIAGTLGATDYLQWVGETFGTALAEQYKGTYSGRALSLKQAMGTIEQYELELNHSLLEGFTSIPGLQIRGITSHTALPSASPPSRSPSKVGRPKPSQRRWTHTTSMSGTEISTPYQ